MISGSVKSHCGMAARSLVLFLVALLALSPSTQEAVANDDGAIQFVQKVTRELVSANRSGSVVAFSDSLKRNANVSAIGSYALGSHGARLTPGDREVYHNGMVRFISRYAANESRKYQASHVIVSGPARRVSAGIIVDSKVHMQDGSTYDVQWLLHQTNGGYKVRDAKVQVLLGDYWLSPFLKDLFEKYIAENGSVAALVLALNR